MNGVPRWTVTDLFGWWSIARHYAVHKRDDAHDMINVHVGNEYLSDHGLVNMKLLLVAEASSSQHLSLRALCTVNDYTMSLWS